MIVGLLILYVAEVGVESFEALLPVAPVVLHPVGDVPQRSRPQPSRSPLGLPSLLDEPRPFQHPQVLGDRGLTHLERGRQVLDRSLTRREAGQDGPTSRVG